MSCKKEGCGCGQGPAGTVAGGPMSGGVNTTTAGFVNTSTVAWPNPWINPWQFRGCCCNCCCCHCCCCRRACGPYIYPNGPYVTYTYTAPVGVGVTVRFEPSEG